MDIVTTRLSENLADEYVEEPRPFRFNPSGGVPLTGRRASGMSRSGTARGPPVADDDRFEDEPGPEPEPEEAVEPEYAPRGRQQRGMRPLRNLSDNVAGRGAARGWEVKRSGGGRREPEPEPSTRPRRVRAPRRV